MAFPQSPLDVLIELFVSGAWMDITSDVYLRDGISITRGRADEGARVDPGKCTLTLNNRSGKYSPRNPTGALYGQIGRNTPLRVSVRAGSPYLNLTGAEGCMASTPDTAALDITGDIDIRLDATLDNWLASGSVELLGKFTFAAGGRSWVLMMRDGKLHFEWSADGSNVISVDSTVQVLVPPSRRLAVRVTLDVNNGASGNTVVFYTADTLAGAWTQLGSAIVTPGTTSIFNSTAAVRVGDAVDLLGFPPAAGRCHSLEIRSGINGTVVANPVFGNQAVGATSFADSAGRTWTVSGGASLTNRRTRFVGEVSSWPTRWDIAGKDVWTPVEASGIMRRLGQGARPLQSTLRRRIPSSTRLRAYWPMEEGQNASRAYSAIAGRTALTTKGLQFGADDSLPGSAALPTLADSASIKGTVIGAASGGWQAEMVYRLETMPATERTMLTVNVAGASADLSTVRVRVSTAGVRIDGLNSDGTTVANFQVTDPAAIADFAGTWNRLLIYTYTSGGTVYLVAAWRDIAADTYRYSAASMTGTTPGRITGINGSWGSDFQGMAIGHLSAFDIGGTAITAAGVSIYSGADDGFNGETAGRRMTRLAGEENIPVNVYGFTSLQEQVGSQRPDTLLSLLQDAADADRGILYERRDTTALQYRDRKSLYNQRVALTLNYQTSGHVAEGLSPVDDDQQLRNDRTVTRVNGSSARAVLESGPLSVQAPPDGVGVYDDSTSLNLYRDEQTEQHAWWLLHLGTWDAARYPTVIVDLAAAPTLIDQATSMDVGDRAQIINPPAWLPPDIIDLLVQGYTETIGPQPNDWTLAFNCTPAGPWTVGVVGDPVLGRADTDGSALTASVTSSATALSIITVARAPEWVTDPAEFPFNVTAGGEVMTATAVANTANLSDGFNRANSTTSMGTADTGQAWAPLVNTWGIQTNRAYAINSANSITSIQAASDLRDLRVTAAVWTAGEVYLLLRMSSAADRIRVGCAFGSPLQLQVVAANAVVRTVVSAFTPVQGDTISVSAQGPFINCYINGVRVLTVYEETGQLLTLVGLQTATNTVRFDDFRARWTQVMTVTRSVNGVVKAQPAGADIRLAQPAIAAL